MYWMPEFGKVRKMWRDSKLFSELFFRDLWLVCVGELCTLSEFGRVQGMWWGEWILCQPHFRQMQLVYAGEMCGMPDFVWVQGVQWKWGLFSQQLPLRAVWTGRMPWLSEFNILCCVQRDPWLLPGGIHGAVCGMWARRLSGLSQSDSLRFMRLEPWLFLEGVVALRGLRCALPGLRQRHALSAVRPCSRCLLEWVHWILRSLWCWLLHSCSTFSRCLPLSSLFPVRHRRMLDLLE